MATTGLRAPLTIRDGSRLLHVNDATLAKEYLFQHGMHLSTPTDPSLDNASVASVSGEAAWSTTACALVALAAQAQERLNTQADDNAKISTLRDAIYHLRQCTDPKLPGRASLLKRLTQLNQTVSLLRH